MQAPEELVYDPLVLDFAKYAQTFNTLIELSDTVTLREFIDKAHQVLPRLYSAIIHLPKFDAERSEEQQRFVTEDDYEYQHQRLLRKLGQYDSFEEVSNPVNDQTGDAIAESLSENLCDIYQDTKDFALLFEIGTHDVMYSALCEVQQSFENYWGQKLVNILRVMHFLRYSVEEIEENEQKPEENDTFNMDTSNWFISRRQQDLSDE